MRRRLHRWLLRQLMIEPLTDDELEATARGMLAGYPEA